MKLNVKALALTGAILWGLGILVLTWWIILFEGASDLASPEYRPPFIALIYRGYSFTPLGSVIGLVWGAVDGLCCGAVVGWVYNCLAGNKVPASES